MVFENARVEVEQGYLEGQLVDSVLEGRQYFSFKGIPYAAPPIGELRFKAPRPPLPWKGIKKVTEHGPNCPHIDIFSGKIIEGNEDCLYLNVYSPNLTPRNKLPVMFYIHGGGYKSGSGDDSYFGPDFLLEHEVIVVTINYRLEALGFLCLDTADVPGNAGLKDQSYALKWVHRNISKFGGDPNNITIIGESAGGAAAALHTLSPMSKTLLKQAISMSGAPFCNWSVPFHPQKRPFILGKQLGIETEDPQELLEFLQSLPVENLINTYPTILGIEQAIRNNPEKFMAFTPVIEKDFGQEAFLLKNPLEYLRERNIEDSVTTMFGHTNDEGMICLPLLGDKCIEHYNAFDDMLIPRKMLYNCMPNKCINISKEIRNKYFKVSSHIDNYKYFVKYLSDVIFVYDIRKFFNLYIENNNKKCYMYKFSAYTERNFFGNQEKYGLKGTSHLDDLLYLFHSNELNLPVNKNEKSFKIIKQMCKLFTNFAKYGDPTPDESLGTTWEEYGDDAKYLDIGEQLIPGREVDADVMEFWDKMYETAGGSYENFIWN